MMDIITVNENTIIYIGKGHSDKIKCLVDKPTYEKAYIQLEIQKDTPVIFAVKQCPFCGKIFLSYKKYDKFWHKFEHYNFISSKDGKIPWQEIIKYSKCNVVATSSNEIIDYHEIYKTPSYIKKGLQHPYQGGRFSPR